MLIVMANSATREQVERVVKIIEEMGYKARPMPGGQRTAIGLVGNDGRVDASRIEGLAGVAEVIHVSKPYKQVSREWKQENTIVTIADTHGNTVSIYFEDPDGNSVEVYWPTGIDVPQPFGKPMDLTKSEEEILARVKQLAAENKL